MTPRLLIFLSWQSTVPINTSFWTVNPNNKFFFPSKGRIVIIEQGEIFESCKELWIFWWFINLIIYLLFAFSSKFFRIKIKIVHGSEIPRTEIKSCYLIYLGYWKDLKRFINCEVRIKFISSRQVVTWILQTSDFSLIWRVIMTLV